MIESMENLIQQSLVNSAQERILLTKIQKLEGWKRNFESNKAQLQAYVSYEKALTGNKTVAILASTNDDAIMVWRGPISDTNCVQYA